MKKFKIAICALLVLCSSFIFAACGEDKKDFDVSKIVADQTKEFVYDSTAKTVSVNYPDVDFEVEYALESDKYNYMSASELNMVDAGTYKVYYKLTADGYNDYISPEEKVITVKIAPKPVTVNIFDNLYFKSKGSPINIRDKKTGVVNNDNLGITYTVKKENGDEINTATAQLGEVYDIIGSWTNTNYAVTFTPAKLKVTEAVEVVKGNTTTYYSDFTTAVSEALSGSIIKLNDNVRLTSQLTIDKSITIDGQDKFVMYASSEYTDDQMILLNNTSATLELKNITVDAKNKARVIKASAGTLKIEEGTTITNGKSNSFVGGVFITQKANFMMNGGSITGNSYVGATENDEYYKIYSTDLWIGANATGTYASVNAGYVGNAYVNSNEYSAYGAGKFTIEAGVIDNLYVEYDAGFGAKFEYKNGTVNNLMVSTTVSGEYVTLEVVEGQEKTYNGGIIGTITTDGVVHEFTSPADLIAYATEHPTDYRKAYLADETNFRAYAHLVNEVVLIGDLELSEMYTFTTSAVINGQDKYTISASDSFTGNQMFLVQGTNPEVVLKDVTLDGNQKTRVIRAEAGKLVVDGATITGGMSASYIGGVYITYSASFEMISGSITGNSYVGATETDEYYKIYSTDLWIGSNASGTMAAINGGEVGNMFVNSNSYSAQNDPDHVSFVMNNGEVDNVYVEYDEYGAKFVFVGGNIDNMYLSTTTAGTYETIDTVTAGTYVGGEGEVA
ncbi:MAG: hypothetical protein E7351_00350 [Clostridiales bacterium]|nr:hypothetical protein [Clostridiales bacterium]